MILTVQDRLNKRARELLKALGAPWTTKIIDLERCVYRDFGDHDVEVSSGRQHFGIYVWAKRPGLHIIENYRVKTVDEALGICREIEARYSATRAAK